MRILYVSNFFPPHVNGGAELIAHAHARRLLSLGHDVSVFAGDFRRTPIPFPRMERWPYDGFDMHRIVLTDTSRWGRANFHNRDVERHFARTLQLVQPDVVHFHILTGLSVGMISQAKQTGAKIVLTVHDSWGFCFKATFLRSDDRVCDDFSECSQCLAGMRDERGRTFPIRLRKDYIQQQFGLLDALVAPSRFIAQSYVQAGFSPDAIRVVGNGVDLDRFDRIVKTPPPPGQTRFTFVGYVGPHKGVAVLLKALARLPIGSGVVMNILGAGVLEAEVHAAARDLADRCTIIPWGRVPSARVDDALGQTDVLILPSICPENQPGTILEAMAAGLPVIASRLGGCIELVDDGVTGRLFEPGHAASLASAMMSFVAHPDRLAPMGQAARRRVADFSFHRQVDKMLAVYQDPSATEFALPRDPDDLAAPAEPTPLILCEGEHLPEDAYMVIDRFEEWSDGGPVRFALADWFSTFPANTRVLWVVDPTVDIARAQAALDAGIAVLYPTQHLGLANLDGARAYESPDDALLALRQLTADRASTRQNPLAGVVGAS